MAVIIQITHSDKIKALLFVLFLSTFSFFLIHVKAQTHQNRQDKTTNKEKLNKKILPRYGVASFYAKKFHGRKMANGEIYRSEKYSAACNILPLNTWIKVTNLKNNRSIILKITDRMNKKNKRLIDLSQSAAKKLNYFSRGLTRVKVEALNNYTTRKNK